MPKSLTVDPVEVRKPRTITVPPIPVNAYVRDFEAEKARHGADGLTAMLHDMIAIREFGGVTGAAVHIGVTHSSLSRWLARRTTHRRSLS